MKQHDWDNLQFLLNIDDKTLLDWYEVTEPDDHRYAAELLAEYKKELDVKIELLKDTEILDLSTANSIISKFTL